MHIIVFTVSIGFTALQYFANESAGNIEVCVRAQGYGFAVNLTMSPLTASGNIMYAHMVHYYNQIMWTLLGPNGIF